MEILVLHDVLHVCSGVVEDEVVASGMISNEGGDIVDLSLERYPTTLHRLVLFEVFESVDADTLQDGHGRRVIDLINILFFI